MQVTDQEAAARGVDVRHSWRLDAVRNVRMHQCIALDPIRQSLFNYKSAAINAVIHDLIYLLPQHSQRWHGCYH